MKVRWLLCLVVAVFVLKITTVTGAVEFTFSSQNVTGSAAQNVTSTNELTSLKEVVVSQAKQMATSDPHTFANFADVVIKSVHLDLDADFDKSVLHGEATLQFEALTNNVTQVILDTVELSIFQVVEVGSGAVLQHTLGEHSKIFGTPLQIQLAKPANAGDIFSLAIKYDTSPNSSGIQWLPSSQTEGKKHPYLFTQFQPIHARSAFPCQDTPAVKQPYTAKITVPKELTALMSALPVGDSEEGDRKSFTFKQPIPTPSYLFALAIGDLVSKDIGPRTRVWTEREKLDASAYELEETELYVKTAEDLLFPYVWGRYDVLILPGSFPYGGMENPCLTFATPTILAGDRSLSGLVAHEIAHSWTGNLVGCVSWEHFWLNEGFTVFVERKILGRIWGEQERHFRSMLGNTALQHAVDTFGKEHDAFTILALDLKGIDPDDAFSSVPYERGSQFLFFIEEVVGGPSVFEPFLKSYVEKFQGKAITSFDFKDYFLGYFNSLEGFDQEKLKAIDWDAWFYQRGMPPVNMLDHFDQTLAKEANDLAEKWLNGAAGVSAEDIKGWRTQRIVYFLEKITAQYEKLSKETLEKMDSLYGFTGTRNSEIRFCWYMLCLKSKLTFIFPHVVEFLKEQGRMKFTRPLYRELAKCGEEGHALALKTFAEHRKYYHNITAKMVARDLGEPN